jgi:hypothetical protein
MALCPVKQATSIFCWELCLRLPCTEVHLGVFIGTNQQVYTIRGPHLLSFMQTACIRASPDSMHYYWINIHHFQAHSLRITAFVALDNAGVTHENIALPIRWNSDALISFLRDGFKHIGELTARTVVGVNQHASLSPGGPPTAKSKDICLAIPIFI